MIDLAVYDADSYRYGDYLLSEVTAFTSHYYAWARRNYQKSTEEPYEVWAPRMRARCKRAADAGMRIHLNFGQDQGPKPPSYSRVLDIVEDVWGVVDRVEVGDELDWGQARWNQELDKLSNEIARRGLPWRPTGAVWQRSLMQKYACILGLDWVGAECYCDLFGQGIYDSARIKADVVGAMRSFAAKVPPARGIVWVAQAYDRNGGWKDMPSLRQLNRDTWAEVKRMITSGDTRTLAINCFSYGRPGGMRDHGGLVKDWTRAAREMGIL